jgi:hypothetical protein
LLKPFLTAVIAAMTMNANAETMLTPHQAEYKLKISVLGGQLNTELRVTPDGYVATHVVKPTGMAKLLASGQISETSQFRSTDDGIRPVKYRSDDSLSRDKTKASIQFDWETGEASGTVDGQAVSSIIEDIAYDRVSIQYELMFDLMNGGPSSQYILFDIDKLKTIMVSNIGRRTVKVPAGEFDAIGVQHQAVGSKRITTMWCVESLDYLPVIVEQHRKGKLKMRAVLTSYVPLGT